MDARLTRLEGRVANVAALSCATAQGAGKDRQVRQVVLFCVGAFRALLEEAYAKWVDGAAEARARREKGQAVASEGVIVPWKIVEGSDH